MTDKILFPDQKIIVTKHFDVHQDWEVPIPGFFIIAAIRKIKSMGEFTNSEILEFSLLIREIRKGMLETLKIDDVYFFQNENTKHGFHFWVFPRLQWMEEHGRKIQSVRPIINYAKENMNTVEVNKQVKEYVEKMKTYLRNFDSLKNELLSSN